MIVIDIGHNGMGRLPAGKRAVGFTGFDHDGCFRFAEARGGSVPHANDAPSIWPQSLGPA
ncbi:hypothetical protein QWZ10_02915 [Paracoccus cavernae]|uniref:Uncharacterized protein n=1 Tax=Paracoccus cavernae TaxID=1571207 RepID=A0ABT8D2K8_9RHOB|nr:hypothetical protein [Paracoccus cavernae]